MANNWQGNSRKGKLQRIYMLENGESFEEKQDSRHPHWEKYIVDIAEHPFHCSICGWCDYNINQKRVIEFNYCPNCGSKMDLEWKN